MPPNLGQLAAQESAAAKAVGYPTGDVFYVDSANGSNGNDGLTKRHAFLTLTYALTMVAAGDTIVLNPQGGETVTATIAANVARVKIVCPVRNPRSGYTITGAGTLALMTVTAADVHVSGVQFAHTGTTSAGGSGILTTNAADRLTVSKCVFDDSAIATTFAGVGVNVVNACDDVLIEDSIFLDNRPGIAFTIATGIVCARPRIERCQFFIGKLAALGIESILTGTGIVQGLTCKDCEFVEATGAGAVATVAWDGTNGANATVGPIKFAAAVDQFLVSGARAYGLANYSFANLVSNAGAGDFVDCLTNATVVGSVDAIYSDTTAVHTQTTAIDSDITIIKSDTTAIHLQTTAIDSDITIIKSDTTAVHLQTTTVASDLVQMQAGYHVMKTGVNADIAGIPNNAQSAGGLLATATGGDVLIVDIILAKDATSLTGPTNLELTTDNTYGDTGAADPVALIAASGLAANTRTAALGVVVFTTLKLPFILESGKKLYIHGDDAAGTSGGNYKYCVRGHAANSSTTLV